MPAPSTVKGLQRFLGMANFYRRFIPRFSEIAAPLYELIRKENPPEWQIGIAGTPQNQAFENLKSALVSYPVLRLPDFSQEFVLLCDASKVAVGATLAQKIDGFEHPCHFVSKRVPETMRTAHSYELETYALVVALDAFYHYLMGNHFVVVTDCRALSFFRSVKNISVKIDQIGETENRIGDQGGFEVFERLIPAIPICHSGGFFTYQFVKRSV
jgi:hypothetical protein